VVKKMIEIKSLRRLGKYWKRNPWDMRIDRKSPVGNPHYLKNKWDDTERKKVCDKYAKDFPKLMTENSEFKAYIRVLERIWKRHHRLTLYCWCTPKQCHGETIKAYLEERRK
jgi:hypothetical protein